MRKRATPGTLIIVIQRIFKKDKKVSIDITKISF